MPSPCSRGRQDGGGRAEFHCTNVRQHLATSSGGPKLRTEDTTLGFYECCAVAVGESLKENTEEAERVEREMQSQILLDTRNFGKSLSRFGLDWVVAVAKIISVKIQVCRKKLKAKVNPNKAFIIFPTHLSSGEKSHSSQITANFVMRMLYLFKIKV